MKKAILVFAVAFATLGTGCISYHIGSVRTSIAIDTLYSEDPNSPGTYIMYNDTLLVTIKDRIFYIGKKDFGREIYSVARKK